MSESTLSKIAITSSADEALTNALTTVNQNFSGGRVTKADLASWFILHGSTSLNASLIEEIQRNHFNQVTYLESLLKKLKSSGRDSLEPGEIANLQTVLGQQNARKRGKSMKTQSEASSQEVAS